MPGPEIIAHRGDTTNHTENSLAAFMSAIEAGVDSIELDVHATADGTVVVHHDRELSLDGGTRQPIAGLTWAQVRDMTLESPVPRLTDVLEVAAGPVTVYVEIKAPRIAEFVCATVNPYKNRCAVHSFDHRVIRRCREIAPGISRGVLMASYLVDPISPILATGSRDLWQHWDLIDEALVSAVHANRARVIAWTVNSVAEARRLVAMGVDGICTDAAAAMRQAFPQL